MDRLTSEVRDDGDGEEEVDSFFHNLVIGYFLRDFSVK